MTPDGMNPNTSAPADHKAKGPASTLLSRNVTIAGHRTSVRLEPEMWNGLIEICRRERASMHEVCTAVAQNKAESTSLTAAIRVFIMAYFRAAATEDGHSRARHGQGIIVSTAVAAITRDAFARMTAPPAMQQAAPLGTPVVSFAPKVTYRY